METTPANNKKSLLQNDRVLVCGMLAFYGLCIIGLAGTAFWWLNQENQALSMNATATAEAIVTRSRMIATEMAHGTATAIARATELAQYELIDRFDVNINHWRMGPEDNDYWTGSTQVTAGVYIWDVREVKEGFFAWSDFPGNGYIRNYDTYVDTKIDEADAGNPCSGLMFRKSPLGLDTGAYSFVVCNSGYFIIKYHNVEGSQEINSQYHPSIRPFDWNRLEVLVNGPHFAFLINNQTVYEGDDDRQTTGGVALMIDVDEAGTMILFDNFGYQSR